jgi:hypothetical protein
LVVLCFTQEFLKEFSFLIQVFTGLHPNEKMYKLLIYIAKINPLVIPEKRSKCKQQFERKYSAQYNNKRE